MRTDCKIKQLPNTRRKVKPSSWLSGVLQVIHNQIVALECFPFSYLALVLDSAPAPPPVAIPILVFLPVPGLFLLPLLASLQSFP